MTTSLDKLENKVQIYHRHVKCFHMVKRLRNSVQYIWRYLTKYAEPQRDNTTQFWLECSPPKLLDWSSPKFLHDIVALVGSRSKTKPSCNLHGERAKNARSICLPSFKQHYLVAMATSLDKLENKVQIHHRHVKDFHIVKRLRNSVQYIWRYSTKYADPRRDKTTQFRLESFPPKLLDRSSPKFYMM